MSDAAVRFRLDVRRFSVISAVSILAKPDRVVDGDVRSSTLHIQKAEKRFSGPTHSHLVDDEEDL